MKYDTSYTHIPDGPARYVAAMEDAREYFGNDKKFNHVMTEIGKIDSFDVAALALSFTGIQGFPAKAMWTLARAIG